MWEWFFFGVIVGAWLTAGVTLLVVGLVDRSRDRRQRPLARASRTP